MVYNKCHVLKVPQEWEAEDELALNIPDLFVMFMDSGQVFWL